MPLLIEDTWLPATLTAPPMTDEEFLAFCNEHPDLSFETTASGELIVMPQTYTKTGFRNQEISGQLWRWAKADGRGLALPFTSFEVPSSATNSALIRIDQPDDCAARTFYVSDLPLETGLAGALALDSPIREMKLLMFPGHELR